jgi:hypothetical protein
MLGVIRALLWARIHYIAGQKLEQLPPQLRELAEKYRRGIAEALGVPPEMIKENIVTKWVTHLYEAFTGQKPPMVSGLADIYVIGAGGAKRTREGGWIY